MGDLFSLFVTFVLLSCSRVCLLDVSRLLGLTLRHSAPVCSCHRDSLTRWRLAFAQEAVRVVSSSASSQLFFGAAMCLAMSDSLRGMSLQEKWTYEGPASPRNFVFHIVLHIFASLTVLDQKIGIRLEALEMCYLLVLSVYPPGLVENETYELT